MNHVQARSYASPTLVLLALNWEDAVEYPDFLGFAIKRTPGFRDPKTRVTSAFSWLPNRITFAGAVPNGVPDAPSNQAPIQKFQWWDSRIDDEDLEQTFTYEIWPCIGQPAQLTLLEAAKTTLRVMLPAHEVNGFGTWFNRAVVSSQAFTRLCEAHDVKPGQKPAPAIAKKLRSWLGNGMEQTVPAFLDEITVGVGAIYHLTDEDFIIPAFQKNQQKKLWMVYDAGSSLKSSGGENPNADAIAALGLDIMHTARAHTNIMHNKFIVGGKPRNGTLVPSKIICGSANYTTQGLTQQANVIHTIESEALANAYLARANLLLNDPSVADTKKANTGWIGPVAVGGSRVRLMFSPEANKTKVQMDTIVQAINDATDSVFFCLFAPTDQGLRDACFDAADRGMNMLGLVNRIATPKAGSDPDALNGGELATLEMFNRARDKRDVIDARYFDAKNLPAGFEMEMRLFPGDKPPPFPPVIIHHKFIIIDGETDHPTIYTGSANMSNNSVHNNDENLLEIKGNRDLAQTYLAEFMRLFEHYRARAIAIDVKTGAKPAEKFTLKKNFADWGQKYFLTGSAEQKSRVNLAESV